MRLTSRPARTPLEQRRERDRLRRATAGPLAQAFPDVEQLGITLNFVQPSGPSPPPQKHRFFPPATMILEFPCPHGDCDGLFDLTGVAVELLSATLAVVKGVTNCLGSRTAPHAGRQPCVLSLRYHIAAIYRESS
jgi:hypothetical protein